MKKIKSITSSDMIAYMLKEDERYDIASIFGELLSIENYFEDFYVSKATLEHVFLKLAREQQGEGRRQSDENIVSR